VGADFVVVAALAAVEGAAAAALPLAAAVEVGAGRGVAALVGFAGFFAGVLSLGGVGAGIESDPFMWYLISPDPVMMVFIPG
jgi:hypothetical protein